MVLKDWKKVGKNQWNNRKLYLNLSIEPIADKYVMKWKYTLMIYNFKDDKDILSRMFKSESNALKFAKKYMEKH